MSALLDKKKKRKRENEKMRREKRKEKRRRENDGREKRGEWGNKLGLNLYLLYINKLVGYP